MNGILLLLVLTSAGAGGIAELYGDATEAHYALCRRTEQEVGDDPARVVGVWKACLAEAERLQYTALLPAIRGNLAMASAQLDASRGPAKTEDERVEAVLLALARQRDVEFRLESLSELMRRYVSSDRGRSRMDPYRDISFRWSNQDSIDQGLAQVNEVVRRYIEDAGFRWADFGSQSGARADIVCRGTVRARVKAPEAEKDPLSKLPVVETIIAIDSIRLVSRESALQGFLTSRSAQATTEQGALDLALHEAAQAMAANLLHRVIEDMFAGTIDAEEHLEPSEDL
jgi:hypothetical protein